MGASNAVARFHQQPLDAARRVEAKFLAVGASEYLVDFSFESGINSVLGFLDYGIQDNEPAAVLENSQHFSDHPRRAAKMMQAESHKGAIENISLERQSVHFARRLAVRLAIFLVFAPDVEHG